MLRVPLLLRLLAMPLLWMGIVQLSFAELSYFFFKDNVGDAFFESAAVVTLLATFFLLYMRRFPFNAVSTKEAILFAVLTWFTVGFLGAVPIFIITGVSWTDAVFESISALTTTGATVLSGLDDMPKTFLLYRQFLQWMGGLGVVIFVVAVLPMLNVGGMKLLKAETPGPMKDDKLSPRIKNSADRLWYVYLALTLICALAYWLGGMSAYDAIAHSLATISTGGFSTHDSSMGYFDSSLLLWLCNFFMIAGAISFALHYRVFKAKRFKQYIKDEECLFFLWIILAFSLVAAGVLYFSGYHHSVYEAISQATFHVISFITSTGFGAGDFSSWPMSLMLLLIVVGYIGGCAGSTAGGNKVIRSVIAFRTLVIELKQMVHPNAVFVLKYQKRPVADQIRNSIIAFMWLVFVTSIIFTFLVMLTGEDFVTSFSAVSACVNVLGPGFGDISSNFAPLNSFAKWLLSFAMVFGRLEYFTVIVLLTPYLWRS
ncbi:TrkH family potassium uptake protein [Marinomonas mediterranea]|uniref:TrkH family potassium uptake protein n=1 Tax=Marinomonas mediterranea TaxID=119864 RepID=UPI00234B223A|nr:TrkH family potassium uptake protein [Marinomonas mediterranea]